MSLRLLYIEDNLDNQFLVGLWFKRSTFELTMCATAEEAIALVDTVPVFDAVILDVNLPGHLTGAAFLSALRTRKGYDHVPVIMVSGHTTIDHVPGLNAEQYQFFLSKPFRKQELFGILSRLFPEHQS